jgi:cellulose synthase/poly-beta-1,6-N-acetylglucosamine synthase-like glycosyltransferase
VSQISGVPLLRPTHRASASFVPTVGSGSTLDMDVRPAEATDQEITFQIAFLNQAPAPAVVALAARASDDALCVHVEPPDPVVVPPGATAALATVHVSPKERGTSVGSQRHEIEVRGRRVGSEHLSTSDLVVNARFTYAPRPAMLQRTQPRLGQVLVEAGLASASDIHEALQQQAVAGGRLGAILVSANRINPRAIAWAVAQQQALPFLDLQEDGGRGLSTLDPQLFDVMPQSFWREHLLIPWQLHDDQLTVAMVNPADEEALTQLRATTGWRICRAVTGYRDIVASLQRIYAQHLTEESRLELLRTRPDDSAFYTLTAAQRKQALMCALVAVVGLVLRPLATFSGLNAIAQLFYLGLIVLKLTAVLRVDRAGRGIEIPADELRQVDRADLPIYTVLVPTYHEAQTLPTLAKALSELDYPHDRLDVKLLLEADDTEMIAAARTRNLPNFIDIIVVPPSQPQTKPKACNYGLRFARGEYTVIFDAEDIPEPDQLLKAVVAFRKAGPDIACLQAKLAYFNPRQNLLTRWFTAEYVMWFDLMLPVLHAAHLPIPLGGTSNHFRTAVLRDIGAWDPFNVTEDADLGIRLYKAGYQTAVLDATTYEEANSRLGNWIRQRSRWIKGYMQTWLVHMRHPLTMWRSMGITGCLGFHALIGGTWITFALNPLYAFLLLLWYVAHPHVLESVFAGWVYFVAATNLFLGAFVFTYVNMVAVARRKIWDLLAWTALSPLYWGLMSIAAWRGLVQLIRQPSYWDKTTHGLTTTPVSSASHRETTQHGLAATPVRPASQERASAK